MSHASPVKKRPATAMSDLPTQLSWIRDRWPADQPCLLGCSGGMDSVVLLALLRVFDYPLIVCHLNHGLRGSDAAADAELVRKLAADAGYPVEIETMDVASLAQVERLSLETAGRQARHRFFDKVARKVGTRRVFLAHHADDQCETVLMRLGRGASARGFSGMATESTSSNGLILLRPLLQVWREDLLRFAKEKGLTWREDESNRSPEHLRNRLRHAVIPALRAAFGRDIRPALLRAAETAAEDEAYFRPLVKSWLAEHAAQPNELPVVPLRLLASAVRQRVLREWLSTAGVGDLSSADLRAAASLLDPTATCAKVNLARGLALRRRAGRLFIDLQ